MTDYQKRYRAAVAAGRCPYCRQRPAADGVVGCRTCMDARNSKKKLAASMRPPGQRPKIELGDEPFCEKCCIHGHHQGDPDRCLHLSQFIYRSHTPTYPAVVNKPEDLKRALEAAARRLRRGQAAPVR